MKAKLMSKPNPSKPTTGTMSEQMQFLRRLMVNPRNVGAIAPSGPALAQAMVSQIDMTRSGPVVELGPGPGAITRELLTRGISPDRLTVIERDPEFVQLMTERFVDINVVQGDAFDFDAILMRRQISSCAAVISGLPLLNFPLEKRNALLKSILAHLADGAPFIQFSYGLKAPVAAPKGASMQHAAFVWKNLPPAHVWVYRKV